MKNNVCLDVKRDLNIPLKTKHRKEQIAQAERTNSQAKPLNRNFTSVFSDRTSFRAKGLRFVPSRWHCPCSRLQERNRKEGEGKRARGQEGKRRRCEDEKM